VTVNDMTFTDALKSSLISNGKTLWDVQNQKPTLLVFLRHLGCTYCREAVADVAKNRGKITANGTQIIFVHMSDPKKFADYITNAGLAEVGSITDPEKNLYHAFNLKRGNAIELFGPKALTRAVFNGSLFKHGLGAPSGDPLQMPGTFLIHKGKVIKSFIHKSVADRPDYCELSINNETNYAPTL
jgi:peroxiredoxin